jgi:diguanylate cyclase (GGDEF)-like protein/putative nucleotidyltransferase with HDIG domain
MPAIPTAGRLPTPHVDRGRLAAACRSAEAALAEHEDAGAAIDAALGILHDAFDGSLLVTLFVREHDRLWLLAQQGYRLVPDGVPVHRGVVGRAARSGTQLVEAVSDDPDYVGEAEGIVSELAVALGDERPAPAVLNVESRGLLTAAARGPIEQLASALAPRVAVVRGAGELDVSALARLFVHSSSLRDVGAIADLAARTLVRLLRLDSAQVNLGLAGRRHTVAGSCMPTDGLEPLATEIVETLATAADRDAVLDLLDLADAHPQAAHDAGRRGVAWLPLRTNGVEIGVLLGSAREPLAFDRARGETAALLAAHAAASIDAAQALTRERQAALTDPLTGVLNRRGFDDRLTDEIERSLRAAQPFSVVVFDCDDFKRVNDTGGHELGDRVLSAVGRHLQAASRSWDVAARIGGDEFVVLLPGAAPPQAHAAATRLRLGLGDALAEAGHDLSISVGIACYPDDGRAPQQLLRAADRAMYRAKELGKDRAVAFADLAKADLDNVVELRSRRRGAYALLPNGGSAEPLVVEWLDALTASTAALAEHDSREEMLERTCGELLRLLGAAYVNVSQLEGGILRDVARRGDVDVPPTEDYAYALDDYPLTQLVVEAQRARGVSVVDEDAEPSEVFVLRHLGMGAVLIVPVVVSGRSWGIVEVYDTRPRRFTPADVGVAEFVVEHAGRLLAGFEHDEAAERLYWETLGSVTNALEAKDAFTSRHTQEVRALAASLAERLDMAECDRRTVELGALLHDIGKIRVPESILNKPGPLDEDEWLVIRTHPEVGERILAPITPLRDVLPIVRSHHERWDGGGYPDGLAADSIPLGARVIAVCDAWRAMNEPRPYRAPLPRREALAELRKHAGSQFDPQIVAVLEDLLDNERADDVPLHRPPAA